jgi:hypothetical protein
MLSGPRFRNTATQKNLAAPEIEPGTSGLAARKADHCTFAGHIYQAVRSDTPQYITASWEPDVPFRLSIRGSCEQSRTRRRQHEAGTDTRLFPERWQRPLMLMCLLWQPSLS